MRKGARKGRARLSTADFQTKTSIRQTDLPSVNQTAARRPVELELARAVGHRRSVEAKRLGSGVGSCELNEAVSGVTERDWS